jgi:diguanylate cyclase
MLIASFAGLLSTVFRKVDFIARFGGDEFIVLLPETGVDAALDAANRLYKELKRIGYFIPALEEITGKKASVPREQRLTCSIGIASNYDLPDISKTEETLTNADRALFFAKAEGKGRAILFRDIPASRRESLPSVKKDLY